MRIPFLFAAGVLAGALVWSAAAQAVPGEATGDVNMRRGPGTGYAKITTIPAGAPVEVIECPTWCQVIFAGQQGWVSSNYIATGGAGGYAPDAQYAPQAPVYAPGAYVYRSAPVYRPAPVVRYAYRSPMPPRAYWRHGRPWWDDRYDSWYDGRDWWYDGDWYGRPRSGVSFEFGF